MTLDKRFKRLAEVWNQPTKYPANYDMERALGMTIHTIRKRVEEYRDAQHEPELIHRDRRGGYVAVPPSVQKQLDEFRFDPDLMDGKKGIIVTAAQFGAPLNTWFWRSLERYAKYRGFPLAVLPIKYGTAKTVFQEGERRLTSTFPDELKGHIVLDDLELPNLRLSTARLRPTLQRFLTDEVCDIGRNMSVIFGTPSLELEHRPRIGHSYPKASMTTGAVTHPNYQVDNIGQQDRTGLIASKRHCFSAIIVEFDGGMFHFRQLLANKRGEFYDLCGDKVMFSTPRKIEVRKDEIEALVMGDWHTSKTCPTVRKTTMAMFGTLKPKRVVFHDFIDGDSVSHHGVKEATRLAYEGYMGWDSLEDELSGAVAELEYIRSKTDAEIHLVPSNHPEFVEEYINSMRWTKDKSNMAIGAELFLDMVNDLKRRKPKKVNARATDPIALYLRKYVPDVNIIERQQYLTVAGTLLSLHGDIGTRGSQTRSMQEFRKMNTTVVLGHNHSAAILGKTLWRVGTSTPRKQFYVKNPVTNWTNTHLVIYKNGQKQLLNIIKGKWHG